MSEKIITGAPGKPGYQGAMEVVRVLILAHTNRGSHWLEELLVQEWVMNQINVTWASQLKTAMGYLNAEHFDAMFLELDLPDSRGIETFLQLKQKYASIPVVVLTNENNEALASLAVQEGAQDYLTQGQADPKLFIRTLHHAIERKRIELDLERKARELQALYETSLEINAQVSLPALLSALVDRAARLLDVPMSALYMLQPDGQTLRLEYGFHMEHNYRGVMLQVGEGLSGRAAQTGETIAIADYQEWEGRISVFEGPAFRRVLAIPLKSGGQVIGVINLSDHLHSGAWTEEELRLANLFADQAAIAVQNARLLEAERQKSAELARSNAVIAALSQVASRLGATQKPEQIVETIGNEMRQMGISILFAMFNQDPKSLVLRYLSVDQEVLKLAETMLGLPIIGYTFPDKVWSEGDQDLFRNPRFLNGAYDLAFSALPEVPSSITDFVLARMGLTRSVPLLLLPLVVKDEPIGLMMTWGNDLRPDDLPAFTVFSNQVAVTLENARLYNHIERLATTDELSRIYNRRGFFLLGEQQMRLAQRTGSPMLLIFIDVDQLKYINDHFGHKEGDRALIATAEAMRNTFRSADIIARISGDEFAVLATPTAGMGASRLLERLQHEIDNINGRGELPYSLSVSAGFAVWIPGQSESMDELLARADAQMYQEKRRKTGPLVS